MNENDNKFEDLLNGIEYANPVDKQIQKGRFDDLSLAIEDKRRDLEYTNVDLGLTIDEWDEANEAGITPNPYINNYDLNKAKSDNQSGFEQFGNFLIQSGYGEVLLGGLEGFGNIYDGLVNLINGGDNYERSAWTKYFEEAKANVKKDFAIHRENPNDNFDFGDFGYWMSEGVNVFTTLSLMLPAYGWTRGLSYLGKLTKLNKVGNWATRGVSKGISKAASAVDKSRKYPILKNIANRPGLVEKSINDWNTVAKTAFLSRTGENFLESKTVYDDVYKESLEKINDMSEEEYQKFINNNEDFKGKSNEEIAKIIANNSADKTFFNDYAALIQDVIHLKALGALFGKNVKRSSTAKERIAAKNQKSILAGADESTLIKDNINNRIKESLQYAIKHPINSVTANHIWEGFEEIYQGIQVEKGKEVAKKYFDPNFTPRSIESYLNDTSIWEQGFWGMMGSVVYGNFANIYSSEIQPKLEAIWKKNHLTPEQYEIWKRSENNIAIERLNSLSDRSKKFVQDMEYLNNNENPFEYVIDPVTKKRVIQNGELVHKKIDDNQKELLQQEAIDEFVKNITLDGVDTGTFDLMVDILSSPEFDKFISDNNVKYSNEDKILSQQIVDRMKDIAGVYTTAVNDMYSVTNVNPYVANVAARYITRKKFDLENIDSKLMDVDSRLAELSINEDDFSRYTEEAIYKTIKSQILYLDKLANDKRIEYNEGKISNSALDLHLKNIARERKELLKYLTDNTTKGSIEAIKELIKSEDILDVDLQKAFDDFSKNYESIVYNNEESMPIPQQSIKELIDKKIGLNTTRSYVQSTIPINENEIKELYDDFSLANDKININRINSYIDLVKDYLRKAENFDEAFKNVLKERTGDKKVDEALNYLKYGYFDIYNEPRMNGQMKIQFQFDTLLDSLAKERAASNENIENAKKQGVELPDDSPSTGGVVENIVNEESESVTEDVVSVDELMQPSDKPVQEIPDIEPETIVVDQPVDNTPEDEDVIDEETMNDVRVVDAAFRTPKNLASNDASVYITKVFFTQKDKIREIAESEEKQKEFIEEIVRFLTDGSNKRKYSEKLARQVAIEQLRMTSLAFSANTENTAYVKLANSLARGFNENGANTLSVTQLIDGEGIPEVLNEFLDSFVKINKIQSNNNGVYIIDLNFLFKKLIKDPSITRKTAIDIYNNLISFLSTNTESNYKFLGYLGNKQLSAEEFFNELDKIKENITFTTKSIHVEPIPVEFRDENYVNAVIAANNGAKTYAELDYDVNGRMSNISIYVDIEDKKNKTSKRVKIGILRTVDVSKDLNIISPTTHRSGFRNNVIKHDDKSITLDCDDIFNAIINSQQENNTDSEAKELYDILLDYFMSMYGTKILQKLNKINDEEVEDRLLALMGEDTAKKLLNNKYIKNIIKNGQYKFYNKNYSDIKKAKELAETLSTILFHGSSELIMRVDYYAMLENYEDWKRNIANNYEQTANIQKLLKNNEPVILDISIPYDVNINGNGKDGPFINIRDAGFQNNPRSRKLGVYTPLYMVNENGYMIDEHGNNHGKAKVGIGEYSMGFVVGKDGKHTYTAHCVNAVPIDKDSKLIEDLKNELNILINEQFNNTNNDTHDEKFDELIDRFSDLFGIKGLFRLNDLELYIDYNNNFLTIRKKVSGNNYTNVLTLFKKQKDISKNSTAINVYSNKLDKTITTTSSNNTGYYKKDNKSIQVSNTDVKNAINDAINTIVDNIKLNRSSNAFNNTPTNKRDSKLYYKTKGRKFAINLGGNIVEYDSYGDFIVKNGGFETNVFADSEGKFIEKIPNSNYLMMEAKIKTTSDIDNLTTTNVSDLLFVDRTPKSEAKSIKTELLLQTAGVEQEKIDVLLGKNGGPKILINEVYPSLKEHKESNDGETNAFYQKSKGKGKIFITPKGAASMNKNPNNDNGARTAIRLLIHENVHREFQRKDRSNKEKERILDELIEVYDYLQEKLIEDYNTGKLDKEYGTAFSNSVFSVLNKLNKHTDIQVKMEEFLAETLSQPVLIKYMNNTEYFEDIDIKGIKNKNKSIFQKFIDVLLKLFGINDGNLKNNSILAKQYLVLSKTSEPTTNKTGLFKEEVSDKSPVKGQSNKRTTESKSKTDDKLDNVKKEIDKVIDEFDKRIKRSDNFEEDHIYYIDGKKADTSVTQRIHGNEDIGAWKTPSTSLGNTADTMGREYFENNGNVDTDIKIPNLTVEINVGNKASDERSSLHLKEQFDKMKEYLDNRFGKNKYRVITKEFPIGGIISKDGKDETIAGTMDMLVYTESGDIYIFDFKTKRYDFNDPNSDSNIDLNTLMSYKAQLNIYRQLIEENFPHLKGRIKLGGLIKFNVYYPNPNDVEYRLNPNDKKQLQIKDGDKFVNIENYSGDYMIPTILDINDENVIIDVAEKDYRDVIKSLPKLSAEEKIDIQGTESLMSEEEQENYNDYIDDLTDFDDLDLEDDDYNSDDYDTRSAVTDLIVEGNLTSAEIYAQDIVNGSTDNAFGIRVVTDLNNFVESFPQQYRGNIRKMLDSDELNYTCS